MIGKTHMAGGLLSGLACCHTINLGLLPFVSSEPLTVSEIALFTGIAIFGSLVPDIDTRTSKMGRKAGAVSSIISVSFGHRTLFHSPLFVLLVCLLGIMFIPQQKVYIAALVVGMLSHLLLDMLNRKGIPLLWPLPKKYHIASVQTGSITDKYIMFALLALSVPVAVML